MMAVGIDLAGKETNPTGFCIIEFNDSDSLFGCIEKITVEMLYNNNEILDKINPTNPDIIAIDAPFSRPINRPWRHSEQILLSKGFKPISCQLANMGILADRAIVLNKELGSYRVIETFSRAVEKILDINKNMLMASVEGKLENKKLNKDQYDAILCALCGMLHLKSRTEIIGNTENDMIVLPGKIA
ncbi:MAG: DUF429 domain-containing protein [Candidatus Aenigmarchaeota archaeon]|nr:DUF429 domain-containing protein [Candidatus Aenigmarchaeota archaeon]